MIKKYLLIFTIMLAAFAFSNYAGNHIFIANTPSINRNYLADLGNQIQGNINKISALALSIKNPFYMFNGKENKNNIAFVNPTAYPINTRSLSTNSRTLPTNGVFSRPTVTPRVFNLTKDDLAAIPANLFKPYTTGVSAYEISSNHVILKVSNGTIIKTRKLQLSDGRIIDVLDFTN
jgi:hypothetical protein